mmetsp:Transcript_18601/g.26097  ORF Transcript_18601/g.26097 Transcript_18601/m.26097 type:complete len:283 (+) Transcript_18601:147-995(+)
MAGIPESFDPTAQWPECSKVLNDIQDASTCGCSWAMSVTSALSSQLCIATNGTTQVPLSSEDVCFNANYFHSDGCNGGNMADSYYYINIGAVTGGHQNGTGVFGGGWCSAYTIPQCSNKYDRKDDPYPPCEKQSKSPPGPKTCDATAKAPFNNFAQKFRFDGKSIEGAPFESLQVESQIQLSLMTRGPATTSFTVWADFLSYKSGIFKSNETGPALGGIAVAIVGWGVENGIKYWKAQNSFGKYWGENGFFRIIRGINHAGFESAAVTVPDNTKWIVPVELI